MIVDRFNLKVKVPNERPRRVPVKNNNSPKKSVMHPRGLAYRAMKFLLEAGRPLHFLTIMEGLGEINTPASRAGFRCTLRTYVRRGDTFTRPTGETYGLTAFFPSHADLPLYYTKKKQERMLNG
jgi:hypothetical protein